MTPPQQHGLVTHLTRLPSPGGAEGGAQSSLIFGFEGGVFSFGGRR